MFAKVFRYALFAVLLLFAWNALASEATRRKFRRMTEVLAVTMIVSSVISVALYLYQH